MPGTGTGIFLTVIGLIFPYQPVPVDLITLTASLPPPASVLPANSVRVMLNSLQIRQLTETDPARLGSISLGFPSGGVLVNGRQMTSTSLWDVVNPDESWGTDETIAFVEQAIQTVHALFPDTAPLPVGDISHDDGGRLNRHQTHQAGRDVDLGFYLKTGNNTWRTRGTSRNLDLSRNWALVRALIVHTDVEAILLDRQIQRLLYNYALSIGEDQDWLRRVFQVPRGNGQSVVRHVANHYNHYHVRFYNRLAQEMGILAYPHLLELGIVKPPVVYINHRIRAGQTLGHLARRYGVPVRLIQQANGMRGTLLRVGQNCRIPVRDGVSRLPESVNVPPRCLPPATPPVLAGLDWTPARHPVEPPCPEPALDETVRWTPSPVSGEGSSGPAQPPASMNIPFWLLPGIR